jgi:superfamily I DNA/RNA helicase
VCNRARELVLKNPALNPLNAVIVDEVQDLSAHELRFLSALVSAAPNGLTLFGDGGQRIYAMPFSLKALGIDIRGRSHVLRVNYRTTEQIRMFADRLLETEVDDLDDGKEVRTGTRCLLRGPRPMIKAFTTDKEQSTWIAEKIAALLKERLTPGEVAIFARAGRHLDEIEAALKLLKLPTQRCTKEEAPTNAAITLGTMHRAKGLEFKAVFAVNVSDDIIPNPNALKSADDPKDRDEALNRERQLLYVCVTRARDEACVTWAGTPSRFLKPVLQSVTN